MATHPRPAQRHGPPSNRPLPHLLLSALLLFACYLLGVRAHAGSIVEVGPPFQDCDVQQISLVSASGSQTLWIADRGPYGEPLSQGQYQPISPIHTASPIPPDAVRVEVAFQRASGTVMRSVTTCVVNGGYVQYFRAPSSASPPEDATALPTFALEIQGLINGVNSITINTDCSHYFYGTIVIDDGTSGGNGGGTGGDGGSGSNEGIGGGETGMQDPGTGNATGGASGPAEPQDPKACELSALTFSPFPNKYDFTLSPAFAPENTSYTGVLPADVFLISMKPELAAGTTSAAIITLVVNKATPLVLTTGQESASIALGQEVGPTTNTLELKVTSGSACTKVYTFVFDRSATLSDGSQSSPGEVYFNWVVGSWGPCSASCGPGVTQRSVGCQASDNSFVPSFQNCTKQVFLDSDHNGIPDGVPSDSTPKPDAEAVCNLTPCAGGLDVSGESSTGADGPALTTMCARYAQASFGLGASVTSETRFVKAILRRALDGCGSNICNPSFPGILGDSSPYRTGAATSTRAEKLRSNADNYKDRFLHKVARLFGKGLACDAEGFPISEQPGQDDPSNPSADSENELAQCITDLFPTASDVQRISARRNSKQQSSQQPQLPSLSKTTMPMHPGVPADRHVGHADDSTNPDASAATGPADPTPAPAPALTPATNATGTTGTTPAPANSSPTATQSSLSLSNFASTQLLYSLQSYGLSIDDASLAFQRSGFQAPPQLIAQQQQQNGPSSGATRAAAQTSALMGVATVAGLLATWFA